ncbi:hypothetical protein H8959_003763 [Pygathrix nigripes]
MPGVCDRAPDFLSPSEDQVLRPALGSSVALNCTAWVVSGPHCSLPSVQWLKDGLPLGNGDHYSLHEYSWVKANLSEVLVSSVLGVNMTSAEVYGAFTCSIQNVSSSSVTLQRAGDGGSPGPTSHVAAVLASLLVLLALLLAALLYIKCRLNVLLWYQDAYGEVEMNDGKLYDAYVSYSDCPEDRKFVNFILKPQLERRRGYKLFLDDRDLLPRAGIPGPAHPEGPPHWALPQRSRPHNRAPPPEAPPHSHPPEAPPPPPSSAPHSPPTLSPASTTELRPTDRGPAPAPAPRRRRPPSRRALRRPPGEPEPLPPPHRGAFGRLPEPGLVQPQLPVGPARGWVGPSLAPTPLTVPPRREGLCRLLELTRRPIFITFEGQRRDPRAPGAPPAAPTPPPGDLAALEARLRELQLALPRKVHYRPVEGDPQTQLQDDKDPMLILRGRVPEGRALDSEVDPDPEGDLGVRGPVFGEPSAPPHTSGVSLGEGRSSEVDVSDLGSRNYSARTDFYCLVSKDDM